MSGFSRGIIITPGTDRQLGAYGLFRPAPSQHQVLALPSLVLPVKSADPDILWVSFAELCGSPLELADYRQLAGRFPAWVIDGVPSPAVESASGSSSADAWHRFLDVLDLLHDRDIPLFLIGRGPLDWEFAGRESAGSRPADSPSRPAAPHDRIAKRLAMLRLIESDEQLEDEQTAGS
jgi:cell division protein ZapE